MDDIYFTNSFTGWTFKLVPSGCAVFKTTNGGNSWDSIFVYDGGQILAFRSLGFFDSQTGIAGTLTQDKQIYRTSNGGYNWARVTNHPTIPAGICGISIINQTTAFACGAYTGNARILKTTNAGLSWDSVTTDTSQVRSLIDCYFWSADSGIVVGGYRVSGTFTNSYSAVLLTTNGGASWQRTYLSTRIGEWCWKISFVSRQVGFVSIERFGSLSYILKTTNAGLNWTEIPFLVYEQEGIGFLNENTGWVGGFTNPTYETTNGGANWHSVSWGNTVNRFRFISDTIAYAVGTTVSKFTREPIGIQQISSEIPESFKLHQNYPNPFNPNTKIKFEISQSSFVTIKVYDALGKEITSLANENLTTGIYSVNWDASIFRSGIYFYKIITGEYSESKKMILIK